jgi:Family of unknown function (DUF6461)
MADETAEFAWFRGSPLRDGACITLVGPPDAEDVVRGFGGDLSEARPMSLAAVGMPTVDEPTIAVREVGEWLLVVEVNGWQGSRPEVLRRVSAGGRAVSVYWNVEATTRFSYAVSGRLLTAFEAMTPDRRFGADPDALENARTGLPWATGDWVPLLLALAARVTGVRMLPQWLEGDFLVVPVEPLDDDPATSVYPPHEPLTYDDGPLAWALVRAGDAARIRVAETAARYAADALARPDVPLPYPPAILVRRAGAPEPARPAVRLKAGKFWAKTAGREAGGPDPLAGAFKAVAAANSCLEVIGVPGEELRVLLMGELGNPAPPAGSLGLLPVAGPAPTDRYRWTGKHWLAPVGALTFIRGATQETAADAFAADTATAREGIPALARERLVAFRPEGDWLVAVASHNRVGPIFRFDRLPAGASMASLTWTARGRSWIRYRADGTPLAELDPQQPDPDQRLGENPAFWDPYIAGLPLPFPLPYPPTGNPATPLPVMLAIAERLTGLAFTPQWLDQPHLIMNLLP